MQTNIVEAIDFTGSPLFNTQHADLITIQLSLNPWTLMAQLTAHANFPCFLPMLKPYALTPMLIRAFNELTYHDSHTLNINSLTELATAFQLPLNDFKPLQNLSLLINRVRRRLVDLLAPYAQSIAEWVTNHKELFAIISAYNTPPSLQKHDYVYCSYLIHKVKLSLEKYPKPPNLNLALNKKRILNELDIQNTSIGKNIEDIAMTLLIDQIYQQLTPLQLKTIQQLPIKKTQLETAVTQFKEQYARDLLLPKTIGITAYPATTHIAAQHLVVVKLRHHPINQDIFEKLQHKGLISFSRTEGVYYIKPSAKEIIIPINYHSEAILINYAVLQMLAFGIFDLEIQSSALNPSTKAIQPLAALDFYRYCLEILEFIYQKTTALSYSEQSLHQRQVVPSTELKELQLLKKDFSNPTVQFFDKESTKERARKMMLYADIFYNADPEKENYPEHGKQSICSIQ